MRLILASVMVVLTAFAGGCGGYSNSTYPAAPSPTPAPTTADTVTIDIVRENGAQSFSPNPATLPTGQMVVWHNVDTTTHRVVLNNGTLDTGDLGPGASSAPMRINGDAGAYHCSIHPDMVGTIVRGASMVQ
jgi:plastocyanin